MKRKVTKKEWPFAFFIFAFLSYSCERQTHGTQIYGQEFSIFVAVIFRDGVTANSLIASRFSLSSESQRSALRNYFQGYELTKN